MRDKANYIEGINIINVFQTLGVKRNSKTRRKIQKNGFMIVPYLFCIGHPN